MIATEVIPNLWIGDIRSALDLGFLESRKISVIVNCTVKYEFPKYNCTQIRISVRDRGVQQDFDIMYNYLIKVVPMIHKYINTGERVLVHCYAGCHRSVAIILGFLIKYTNMTPQQAIDTLQSKWPKIGLNFLQSICAYTTLIRETTYPSVLDEKIAQKLHCDPNENHQ